MAPVSLMGVAFATTEDPRRWRMLALLSVAQLLGMSLWMAGSALVPELQARWGLDGSEAGWLTSAVQLGFVAGTALAAVLNLADLLPGRWYFGASALLGALANAGLLVCDAYAPALVLRFLTGACLAGVYPPAMKMVATWFRDGRGLAIGVLVGSLTIGKATPYLVRALAGDGIAGVVLVTSGQALLAAVLIGLWYREGPHRFGRPRFSWGLVGRVVRDRKTRLATAGYLGHMWELYAMWIWMPVFIGASMAARSSARGGAVDQPLVDLIAFGTIAAGGLGCLWGGWRADRAGRERLVCEAMAASGACCLLIGCVFGASPWVLAPLAWLWGFFVVADSAQFSTLVTEVAPPQAVGTALTLQTSAGFLLTLATIQAVPLLADVFGWPWAFPLLALGPAAGIAAILRLVRSASGAA